MMNATMAANLFAEHASNLRGGIELPLMLGNVAVLKGQLKPLNLASCCQRWVNYQGSSGAISRESRRRYHASCLTSGNHLETCGDRGSFTGVLHTSRNK
jgi:hypothetical protein